MDENKFESIAEIREYMKKYFNKHNKPEHITDDFYNGFMTGSIEIYCILVKLIIPEMKEV